VSKKPCGAGIRKEDLLRGGRNRIPDPLCLTLPGKPGKDRRYGTGSEQYQSRSAQSITQPFDARASIVEQYQNYVTNDVCQHAHGQKRNREARNAPLFGDYDRHLQSRLAKALVAVTKITIPTVVTVFWPTTTLLPVRISRMRNGASRANSLLAFSEDRVLSRVR